MDTTQASNSIRTLSGAELANVAGGFPWLPVIGAYGAVLAYVGSLGKDAALRDRRK